jgi:hypothetical protein
VSKQYLIELESDAHTRWLIGEDALAKQMELVLQSFFRRWTGGTVPAVKVSELSPQFEIASLTKIP